MRTTSKPTSTRIYMIFLVTVFIITLASTFAQSAKTIEPSFPSLKSISVQPTHSCTINLPDAFDYTNLKIEIFGAEGEITYSYMCYSISDKSFIIDLANFANGTYSVNVMNGKSTFFQEMIVSK